MKMRILFAILLVTSYCSGQDTATLFPGSKLIRYRSIRPYTIRYRFYGYPKGVRTDRGEYVDSAYILEQAGNRTLVRIERFPLAALTDTAYYELAGLKGQFNYEQSYQGRWNLFFNDQEVQGYHYESANKHTTNINESMPQPYFDGYLNDFVLRYLNLKKGLVAKMPLYAYGHPGLSWVYITVKDKREIEGGAGKRSNAWVIETTWSTSKSLTTYYVDAKSLETLKMEIVDEKGQTSVVKENTAFF